jgi:hypothetical protein
MNPQRWQIRKPWYGDRNKQTKKAFKKNKRALTNAPALGLPDMTKPFFLYIHERLGAVGVLTLLLGSWYHQDVYLSKQLDVVSQGWLPCLCILAATVSWWLKQTNLL